MEENDEPGPGMYEFCRDMESKYRSSGKTKFGKYPI